MAAWVNAADQRAVRAAATLCLRMVGACLALADPILFFSLKKDGSPSDGYIQNVSTKKQFSTINCYGHPRGWGDGDKGPSFLC